MIQSINAYSWAWKTIFSPKIRRSIIIPSLIHTLIIILSFWGIFHFAEPYFFDWPPPELPVWLDWADEVLGVILIILSYILWIIFAVTLLAVGFATFTPIAHLIASPFVGQLSLDAESLLRPINHPEYSIATLAGRTVKRETSRILYWLTRALPLMLLSVLFWVPVMNTLVSVLWFVFSSWMLGLQALDAAADNNGANFKQTCAIAKKDKLNTLVLGAITTLLMLIPIVNFLSLSLSVLAGTRLWVHLNSK